MSRFDHTFCHCCNPCPCTCCNPCIPKCSFCDKSKHCSCKQCNCGCNSSFNHHHNHNKSPERGLLTEFNNVNTSLIGLLTLDPSITPPNTRIAGPLVLHPDDHNDRIWLDVTVNWFSEQRSQVEFIIFRGDNLAGGVAIFKIRDSGEAGQNRVTSFSHVDNTPGKGTVQYFVTARVLSGKVQFNFAFTNPPDGNGPITFLGGEIEANRISYP